MTDTTHNDPQPGDTPGASSRGAPARFIDVVPVARSVGVSLGHRVVLLSVERWTTWADLRFARIDEHSTHRLTRRVPPESHWKITLDDRPAAITDVVGRGDRAFSNGEVRFAVDRPDPWGTAITLAVTVHLAPHAAPLHAVVQLPPP